LCPQVLGMFKSFYFDYKARLANEPAERQWRVASAALFGRLDAFLERAHAVLDINTTCLQFSKLGGERGVEIGGTKGAHT
jgi:dynein heavy chain, axonemal